MSKKESLMDSLMKGIGRRLGTRRREVHQAIARFEEESHQDEAPSAQTRPVGEKSSPDSHAERNQEK